jgi:hypothetical protein
MRRIRAAAFVLGFGAWSVACSPESPDPAGSADAGPIHACSGSITASGTVTSSTAVIDFAGGRAFAQLVHAFHESGQGPACIVEASMSLEVLGAACSLHLEFWAENESQLLLRFATLETDEGCPDIPAGRSYSLSGGRVELLPDLAPFASGLDPSCVDGRLTVTGRAVMEAPGDLPLVLDLSAIQVEGAFESTDSRTRQCSP